MIINSSFSSSKLCLLGPTNECVDPGGGEVDDYAAHNVDAVLGHLQK